MSTQIMKLRIVERPDCFVVEKYTVTRVMIPKEKPPKWLREQGFDIMIRTIHGGCYARDRQSREWYPIDLEARRVVDLADVIEPEAETNGKHNFLLNNPELAVALVSTVASDWDEAKSWLYPIGLLPIEYVNETRMALAFTKEVKG